VRPRTGHLCVLSTWLAASTALAGPPPVSPAAPAAGRVHVSSGSASIVRADQTIPAAVGLPLFERDTLRTGPDGRLGVTLLDNTRVSLGPDSAVRVDTVQYAPAEGKLALALKVLRGATAYVSGRIAKLAPDAVRLETPAAIVGVRGTTLVIQVAEP
jgi:hypothetical protein